MLCIRQTMKSCRSEKHYGVLNFLAPKPRQRLRVFRENAEQSSIRTIQKVGIEISQVSRMQFCRRIVILIVGHESLKDGGHDNVRLQKCPATGQETPGRRQPREQSHSAADAALPASMSAGCYGPTTDSREARLTPAPTRCKTQRTQQQTAAATIQELLPGLPPAEGQQEEFRDW